MDIAWGIYRILRWIQDLPPGGDGLVWIVAIVLVALFRFGLRHETLRQASPGLMTSLGIFGTFCGIYLALYPLDFSPGKMNDSIEELLDGMKVAFLTSLLGLLAAITFRIVAKDKLHAVIPPEQKEVLSRLDAIKQSIAGEGDSSLVTQMQKLRDETREGFGKLDGLAETIRDALVNNLEELIKDLREIIGRQLGEALTKLIENIEEALIKQFGKTFVEFNEATQALKKWQEDHRTQVERLTEAFDQVALKIGQISSDCERIPATMLQLREILAVTDTQLDALNQSAEVFAKMREQAEQSFPLIKEHLDRIGADLRESAKGFDGLEETIRNTFQNAEQEVRKTVLQHSENVQQMTSGMKETLEQTQREARNVAQQHSENVQQIASGMKETLDQAQQETRRVAQQHTENVQQITAGMRDTLEQAQRDSAAKISSIVNDAMQNFENEIRRISEQYGSNMLSIARKCEEAIRSGEQQP